MSCHGPPFRRALSSLALASAVLLTGCASQLSNAIGVANALGAATESAGAQLNKDFAAADKACLYTPSGATIPLALDTQAQCVTRTRALYGPALKAYDDFLALWPAFAALVHFAEAAEVLGRKPDLSKVLALLPDVLRTADAFVAAYSALVSPALPALPVAKAVP
jgi:hypothetical protein